jgi:hypothetical protein
MTPQQLNTMKMALEALELVNVEFVCGNGSHHKKEDRHEWDEDCPITNRWRKAITAIKEALAEHAMRETQRLGQEIEQKIGCVNHDCDQCKAQPEQEPVIGKWSLREVYFDEDGEPISHRSPPQRTEQPAQRTWVGLTEQDLDYLCNLAYTGDEEFALAVQAKLMEKNA